jgi:hypothetical protein
MTKPHEIKMSSTEIQQLQDSLAAIHKQFSAFAETQDQMLFKLSGNPLDSQDKGMIGELREVREDVDKLKEGNKKFYWTATGMVLAGGLLLQIIAKYILKL